MMKIRQRAGLTDQRQIWSLVRLSHVGEVQFELCVCFESTFVVGVQKNCTFQPMVFSRRDQNCLNLEQGLRNYRINLNLDVQSLLQALVECFPFDGFFTYRVVTFVLQEILYLNFENKIQKNKMECLVGDSAGRASMALDHFCCLIFV